MEQLLTTKLYIPPPRPALVPRPRLINQLNAGLYSKLTLLSAPAGFGKTTLVCAWAKQVGRPVAWLSLDEGDNDLPRFLTYFVAALQTIDSNIGKGLLAVLQSPGAVNVEAVLTTLLNEIAEFPDDVVLILDDYHVIESQPIDKAITFLLEHLPSQMHLVIASRIDPSLPLSRLRAREQMTEIRADDLRFTPDEAAAFLNQVMDFDLDAQDIAALEVHTEGWIAGLQLAALSIKGLKRSSEIIDFINSFTGSNRYIQDYLADEVLQQQTRGTKDFLLQTSILNRLSAPLCDAVRFGITETPSSSEGTAVTKQDNSQGILENLETANLFIVPLDNDRCWYRYHHLFADLLRQRLHQQQPDVVDELHIRASAWYEKNGLEIEAFQHAAAGNDIERAARLVEGAGMPLTFRGAAAPVLKWLESLPTPVLDARPSLWVAYASALNFSGQPTSAERKLQAAEAALGGAEPDDKPQDLVGHIAAIRAMMAVSQNQVETIIAQSRRALEYLHPDNLPVRTATTWTLGYAYQLQGDRAAASRAYTEVISISQASGDIISTLAATTGLGTLQESENQLFLAAESYRRGLLLFGDQPQPVACETYLSLARVLYEWNDLDAAQQHGQQSLHLARQVESIDTFAVCGAFLARLKLTQGDVAGAAALLAQADQFMRQHNFVDRMHEVAAVQVLTLLHQGDLAAAADLAEKHELPLSQARVHLAQGDTSAALAVLEPLRRQVEAKGWEVERLEVIVLQAVANHAYGETVKAVQLLSEALALAEPGGFVRTFVDEGAPMAQLLYEAAAQGIMPDYAGKLLDTFDIDEQGDTTPPPQRLIEPLSQREIEVLQLIAKGLSNREISERLFLALDTVKGHNRNIYGKLGVKNRTQAVKKAIFLNIIPPQ
ncbi:MAG: LuxR C-terminal-related transcriptional regulator [Anaerolineales bacterium]|nr:LuxR C-terminal-related transcriptional regulator [Anaerolineales bacterium]